MHVVEMKQVGKRFGTFQALAGVDLHVDVGERVCILGPNGAGKTTTIELMLGMIVPSEGSVRLFGGEPTSREARSRVGAMLQSSGVPEALTVREVIRLYRHFYRNALPTAELIARSDLTARANAQVRTLSGGQKQRLSFALALAGDPDLLFLDEPTSAMDVEARRAFWRQIRQLSDDGKTMLFTTHNLEEAEDVATRIVVIHRGTVLAQGTPAQIKARVASKSARLRTDAPGKWLAGLPGVRSVDHSDGYVTLLGSEPESWLAEFFAEGHSVDDLTVTDADLETAFVSLTSDSGTQMAEAAR